MNPETHRKHSHPFPLCFPNLQNKINNQCALSCTPISMSFNFLGMCGCNCIYIWSKNQSQATWLSKQVLLHAEPSCWPWAKFDSGKGQEEKKSHNNRIIQETINYLDVTLQLAFAHYHLTTYSFLKTR